MSRLRVELCCEVLIAQCPQWMKSMQWTSAQPCVMEFQILTEPNPIPLHPFIQKMVQGAGKWNFGKLWESLQLWDVKNIITAPNCCVLGQHLLACLSQTQQIEELVRKKLLLQPILQDIRQVIERNNQTCHTYDFSRLFQGFSDSPNFTTMWQTSCNRGQFYRQWRERSQLWSRWGFGMLNAHGMLASICRNNLRDDVAFWSNKILNSTCLLSSLIEGFRSGFLAIRSDTAACAICSSRC